MNEEVYESKCPLCKKNLKDVLNFGFFKAKVDIKGKMKLDKDSDCSIDKEESSIADK